MLERSVAETRSLTEALVSRLDGESSQQSELGERFNRAERILQRLRAHSVQQEHRLGLFLEEARRRLPEPLDEQQLRRLADAGEHTLDSLYLALEDEFRGSREDIKDRLGIYLPIIETAKAGTTDAPVLDVACGRGEWLELLQERGLVSTGVDRNSAFVDGCRGAGLEVVQSDLIVHLRSLADASLGAVTGFHIIEHLALGDLIQLLDETVRVLAPGGVAIFETPNPANILVSTHDFYLAPTHRAPLPGAMMKFLVEARGLCRSEIRDLHPHLESERMELAGPMAERFNKYFYGPRDYAVIGYKP